MNECMQAIFVMCRCLYQFKKKSGWDFSFMDRLSEQIQTKPSNVMQKAINIEKRTEW